MWQDVDLPTGLEREAEMVKEHWTDMLKQGSQKVRFESTAKSAWCILNRLIVPEKRLALNKIPLNMNLPMESSPTEDHCRSLISRILEDAYRVGLIKKLAGRDAQHVIDFLNIVRYDMSAPALYITQISCRQRCSLKEVFPQPYTSMLCLFSAVS